MSKYKAKPKTVNGITFDSTAEAAYYALLLVKQQEGAIQGFKLQPKYELQPSFKKNGITHRKIEYIADFEVYHLDGRIEVVDVKGMVLDTFSIKRKLFEYKYPDLTLNLMKFIYGRWMTLEEYQKEKKARKSK
jgi:hypothetical protein